MPKFTPDQLAHMTDLARLHAAVEALEERGWTVLRAIPDPFKTPPASMHLALTWLGASEMRSFDQTSGKLVRPLHIHLTGVTKQDTQAAAKVLHQFTGLEAQVRGVRGAISYVLLLPAVLTE